MIRTPDPDPDVAPHLQGPRVQIGLLTDPGTVADPQPPLRVGLEDDLMADVDVGTDADVLRAEDQGRGLDDAALAEIREVLGNERPSP